MAISPRAPGTGMETPLKPPSPPAPRVVAPPPGSAVLALGLLVAVVLATATFQQLPMALLTLLALTAVAALAAVLVFARRRWISVVYLSSLALVSLPIDKYLGYRDHVGGWPGLRVAAADLLMLCLLPSVVLGWRSHGSPRPLPRSLIFVYGLLLAWYALSSLGAPRRDLAAFEMASAVHALLLAFCAAALFRRTYLAPILIVLAAQLTLHSSFAWAQAITGRSLGLGLGRGPAALVLESFEGGEQRIRPAGLFDHPIVYADSLLLGLPILVAGVYGTRSRLRIGLGCAVAFGLSGLVLTLSRGAWISSALAMVLLVVLAWRCGLLDLRALRRSLGTGLAVLALVSLLFGPLIVQRFAASREGNLRVRFELNGIALRMIAAHPFVGVGLNNFIPAMAAYDPHDVRRYFPAVVHNLYLLEAAESGLPGLLLFLALWGLMLAIAWRRLTSLEEPSLQWFALGIVAALSGFLFSQLTDFSHRLEPLRSVVWVDIGLLFGSLRGSLRTVRRGAVLRPPEAP
ncbi:MAG TPA: O-antigen ligase family protein [Thermoanaerobaculia bacterium]|nr:O-antigen ligase family protein [Thermoanaerobaculia bacterium]